jgi:hypothetical protein
MNNFSNGTKNAPISAETTVQLLSTGWHLQHLTQRVTSASCLRDDFAEDDDNDRGKQKTNKPGSLVSQQNGDERIHGNISQQKRAQQIVSVSSDRRNLACVVGFDFSGNVSLFGAADYDLSRRTRIIRQASTRINKTVTHIQSNLVQTHHAEREPGEQRRQHNQDNDTGPFNHCIGNGNRTGQAVSTLERPNIKTEADRPD